jgi:hypothetical protein
MRQSKQLSRDRKFWGYGWPFGTLRISIARVTSTEVRAIRTMHRFEAAVDLSLSHDSFPEESTLGWDWSACLFHDYGEDLNIRLRFWRSSTVASCQNGSHRQISDALQSRFISADRSNRGRFYINPCKIKSKYRPSDVLKLRFVEQGPLHSLHHRLQHSGAGPPCVGFSCLTEPTP